MINYYRVLKVIKNCRREMITCAHKCTSKFLYRVANRFVYGVVNRKSIAPAIFVIHSLRSPTTDNINFKEFICTAQNLFASHNMS